VAFLTEEGFRVSFNEDEILDEDCILLANRVSSQKPALTRSNVRDREIFRSSGWVGEGATKLACYVSQISHGALTFTIHIRSSAV